MIVCPSQCARRVHLVARRLHPLLSGIQRRILLGGAPILPIEAPASALIDAGIEDQRPVAVLAGRLVADQPAPVDEVLLHDAALLANVAAPRLHKGDRGEEAYQWVAFYGSAAPTARSRSAR